MFFSVFSIGRTANRFDASYIKTVNAKDASTALKISLGFNYQKKSDGYHSWEDNGEKFFISEKQLLLSYKKDPTILTHVGWFVKDITPDIEENLENISNKIMNSQNNK